MSRTWPTTMLSDSSAFRLTGGLWKGKRPPFQTATVVRNTNFDELGALDLSNAAVLEVEERQLAERRLEPGDIVIERSGGGPKQPVGRACYFEVANGAPYSFSNFTSAVRVRDRRALLPRFVAYYLLHLYESGATVSLQRATTGLRNLDWGAYTALAIPRPPIAEQGRVAAVLELAEKALRLETRSLGIARELKRAALSKLFSEGLSTEPGTETPFGVLPETWPVVPLGECCTIQSGVTKGRRIPPEHAVEAPYLRVANVQDGRLNLETIKTILIRKDELSKYALREGDVVLTEGGDLDKLGRGFIWRGEIKDCVHQNHIFAVRTDRSRLLPEFLAYLVQSPYGRAYFLSVAHKTTNLASINQTKLRALPVPIPSLEAQEQITSSLSLIDERVRSSEQRASVLRDLFRALLHDLMTQTRDVSGLPLEHIQGI